jgi:hypothetical protein
MDEDLQLLEAELRRMRPVAPSRALQAALERRLTASNHVNIIRLSWLALPVAAAIALTFILGPSFRRSAKTAPGSDLAQAQPAAMFRPVAAENVLWNSRDEGYVTLANGTQARRIRQSYVDTITWKNSATHASLKWTVPREEVRVTPVTFQ